MKQWYALYVSLYSYDVIKWEQLLCYWPFVRGIYRSPVDSPHEGHKELWCLLWSVPEQTNEQTIEMPVIWDAIAHYDVTVIYWLNINWSSQHQSQWNLKKITLIKENGTENDFYKCLPIKTLMWEPGDGCAITVSRAQINNYIKYYFLGGNYLSMPLISAVCRQCLWSSPHRSKVITSHTII